MQRNTQIVFLEHIEKGPVGFLVGVFENMIEITYRLMIVQPKSQSELGHLLEQLHLQINILTGVGANVVDEVIDIVSCLPQVIIQTAVFD